MKMKKSMKKVLAFLLVLIVTITAFPAVTAQASWGGYSNSHSIYLPWATRSSYISDMTISDGNGTRLAFCVEPFVAITGTLADGQDISNTYSNWSRITTLMKAFRDLYGDQYGSGYYATQIMIWSLTDQGVELSNAYMKAAAAEIASEYGSISYNDMMTAFTNISNKSWEMVSDYTIPSFCTWSKSSAYDHPVKLEYNQDTGKYEGIVTDSNGIMDEFYDSEKHFNISHISGNKWKIVSDTANESGKTIVLSSKTVELPRGEIFKGGNQNLTALYGNESIHASAYLRWYTSINPGYVSVVKKDATNGERLEGAEFKLYIDGTYKETLKTDDEGYAKSDNSYTPGAKVKLEEVKPPAGYELSEETIQEGVIEEGSTLKFTFKNPRSTGYLEIIKKDSKNKTLLAGAQFGIYKTEADAKERKNRFMKVTVNKDGVGTSADIPLGTYYIMETKAPAGYKLSDELTTVKLTKPGKKVSVTMDNTPIYGSISIKKIEAGYSTAVAGAVYGLYAAEDMLTDQGKVVKGTLIKEFPSTNDEGKAQIKSIRLGKYEIKEIKAPAGMNLNPDPYPVELKLDETNKETAVNITDFILTDSAVTGSISIIKKDAEYQEALEGAVYTLYAREDIVVGKKVVFSAGSKVADFPATDGMGKATLSGLHLGEYTIQETVAPKNFQLDSKSYPYSLKQQEGGQVAVDITDAVFTDEPVLGSISIHKVDGITGERPQGNAVFQGAEYALYAGEEIKVGNHVVYQKDDKVADFPAINGEGKAKLDSSKSEVPWRLHMGRYYIKEVKAPIGYRLDTSTYEVELRVNEVDPNVAVNIGDQLLPESVRTAKFSITKFYNSMDLNQQLKPLVPEEGAVFQVYLKSAGSYENALDTERDLLTTNAEGFAQTKDLPYGVYTIHQIKGSEVHLDVSDIVTPASEINDLPASFVDGKTYHYTLTNQEYVSQLKIVKKDAVTKNIIYLGGVQFQIFREKTGGEPITLGNSKQSIFTTAAQDDPTTEFKEEPGTVLLPDYLKAGTYYLEEVPGTAPQGYLRAKERVEFQIKKSPASNTEGTSQGAIPLVEVEMYDQPVYGKIHLTKTGEVLDSFTEGRFVYTNQGLGGCRYELRAKDPIYTPDFAVDQKGERKIIYEADELITEKKTNAEGVIEFEKLPLGTYTLRETKTIDGFTLDDTVYQVTLSYANEDQAVVVSKKPVKNQRQKLQLSILKKSKQLDTPLEAAEFALYASQSIYNYQGEKIVDQGTKIGTLITDAQGQADCSLDLPSSLYMKKESKDDLAGEETTKKDYAEEETTKRDSAGEETTRKDSAGEETTKKDSAEETSKNDLGQNTEEGETATEDPQEPDPASEAIYYLKETKAPAGYYLLERPVYITEDDWDDQTEIQQQKLEIQNEASEVVVTKTDVTGEQEVIGAKLEILDQEGNVLESWISEKEPHLIYGLELEQSYILRETLTPEGYATATDITFQVKGDHQATKVNMINEKTKVEISKQELTNTKELPGAQLTVDGVDTSFHESWISGDTPHMIEGLIAGKTYTLTEVTAPEGYQKAETISFQVKDTVRVQEIVMKDETTKTYVSKKDFVTGEEIPGAKLQITNEQNQVVREWITDGQETLIEKLPVGRYTLTEITAPEGYEVAESIAFEVKDNGEHTHVVMRDRPKDTQPETVIETTTSQPETTTEITTTQPETTTEITTTQPETTAEITTTQPETITETTTEAATTKKSKPKATTPYITKIDQPETTTKPMPTQSTSVKPSVTPYYGDSYTTVRSENNRRIDRNQTVTKSADTGDGIDLILSLVFLGMLAAFILVLNISRKKSAFRTHEK